MMDHIIAYQGKISVSLGLMQKEYVPNFVPWINQRIGIEGTLQRPPYSEAQGIEWVKNLDTSKGTHEVFAILTQERRNGEFIYTYVGHTGIHYIGWPDGVASTGSIIGSVETQGRGLGTEAKLLLLYHAFMVLGLRKMTSKVKAFNAKSVGHLMKCGYKMVGVSHKHHFHEGKYVDVFHFEVFREDWEPIWYAYQKDGVLPRLTDTERAFLKRECVS